MMKSITLSVQKQLVETSVCLSSDSQTHLGSRGTTPRGNARYAGLGGAMAGGNGTRRESDFYPTPADVTEALLSVERFEGEIWEPACGDGAIVDVLESHGHSVLGTDIRVTKNKPGFREADFFRTIPHYFPNIITNPPFSIAADFINHALKFRTQKMAFLLKATFWHAKARHALFLKRPPARLYPLLWRPDFLDRGGSTMEIMWCVWECGFVGRTQYIPLQRPAARIIT